MARKVNRKGDTPKAGPFIESKQARKTPGKTVAIGGTEVIKPQEAGQRTLAFRKGALRAQLGVKEGETISEDLKRRALSGEFGPLAKRRAVFAFKGAIAAGRKTAKEKK
jgi:hypothetical protein